MFIDDKGKLFGKINFIDFLVLVFIFCLISIGFFGWKIITGVEDRERSATVFTYKVIYPCPNCKKEVGLIFDKGTPFPSEYEKTCSHCKCKVMFFKAPEPLKVYRGDK